MNFTSQQGKLFVTLLVVMITMFGFAYVCSFVYILSKEMVVLTF